MPKLKYVGPLDEVEVLGRVVKRNHQAEFTDEEAGRSPDDAVEALMTELANTQGPQDHARRSALVDQIGRADRGEGLLAQGTWVLVTSKKDEDK